MSAAGAEDAERDGASGVEIGVDHVFEGGAEAAGGASLDGVRVAEDLDQLAPAEGVGSGAGGGIHHVDRDAGVVANGADGLALGLGEGGGGHEGHLVPSVGPALAVAAQKGALFRLAVYVNRERARPHRLAGVLEVAHQLRHRRRHTPAGVVVGGVVVVAGASGNGGLGPAGFDQRRDSHVGDRGGALEWLVARGERLRVPERADGCQARIDLVGLVNERLGLAQAFRKVAAEEGRERIVGSVPIGAFGREGDHWLDEVVACDDDEAARGERHDVVEGGAFLVAVGGHALDQTWHGFPEGLGVAGQPAGHEGLRLVAGRRVAPTTGRESDQESERGQRGGASGAGSWCGQVLRAHGQLLPGGPHEARGVRLPLSGRGHIGFGLWAVAKAGCSGREGATGVPIGGECVRDARRLRGRRSRGPCGGFRRSGGGPGLPRRPT